MNRTLLSALALGFLLSLSALSCVSSMGVASPYWESRPLVLYPGESNDVTLNIQNNVGSENATLHVEISKGGEIATLADKEPTYVVPLGASVPVKVHVHIPEDTQIGDMSLSIVLLFRTVTASQPGSFTFGSAFDQTIPLRVISPPPAPTPRSETPTETHEQTTASETPSKRNSALLIMGAVALALILSYLGLRWQRRKL